MKKPLSFLAVCFSALLALGGQSYGFGSLYSSYSFSAPVFGENITGVYVVAPRRAPSSIPASSFADASLVKAARIAERRAHAHSQWRCWQYVKDALLAAGAVASRPGTSYACQAGEELTRRHGFVDTGIRNPYRAPVGAVIVYGGHGAGHVELRTEHGFASDYRSPYRCKYSQVIGIYVKSPSALVAQAD